MNKHYISVLLMVALLAFCGCSNKVKLGGKVTFSDDGSPLTVGSVCFDSGTVMATGLIQPDGTYKVSSESTNDGLPPGKYRVYLTGTAQADGADGLGLTAYRPIVDPKFTGLEASTITADVTSSTKQFDIKVERFSGM